MNKKILNLFLITFLVLILLPRHTQAGESCNRYCPPEDIAACAETKNCREGTLDDLPTIPIVVVAPQPAIDPRTQGTQGVPEEDQSQGEIIVQENPKPAFKPVQKFTPVKPKITCEFEGKSYYPGQKRYECFTPKEQGVCAIDAGYGIPYICDETGNWGVGNDGIAECSIQCAGDSRTVENTGLNCPMPEDTCIYSESSNEGEDLCYSGTGTTGFNSPGCNYSCGPIACPVLTIPVPETYNSCSGTMSAECGDNLILNASWNISPEFGDNSCNIFIQDEYGNHTISNECSGVWSGTQIPGGASVVNGGTYKFFISNGGESCYNLQASDIEFSCPNNEQPKNSDEGSGMADFFEPAFEWVSDLFL